MSAAASVGGVLLSVSLFLFFFLGQVTTSATHASWNGSTTAAKVGEEEMKPAKEAAGKMVLMMNESRRRLSSFQVCAVCTCCGSNGYCSPSPCCYAINCNIPNRPFGFCSFTPRTCNCLGCHF